MGSENMFANSLSFIVWSDRQFSKTKSKIFTQGVHVSYFFSWEVGAVQKNIQLQSLLEQLCDLCWLIITTGRIKSQVVQFILQCASGAPCDLLFLARDAWSILGIYLSSRNRTHQILLLKKDFIPVHAFMFKEILVQFRNH